MKKIISLILCAVMLCAAFTGCSGKNDKVAETRQAVLDYIKSIEGNGILSGQQESTWKSSPDYEMDYIYEASGKYPAIRGLDFISKYYEDESDPKEYVKDYQKIVDRSIEWWNKGGLVTICWHWGAPPDTHGYAASKKEIDLDEAFTEGTELNKAILEEMDEVAESLKQLQDEGVIVLWRPFHEFDGKWFWWGMDGEENFIKLWQLMYDRYTNYHELNNLIWVLGYSGSVREGWYPGDEYVDITGLDSYSKAVPVTSYKRLNEQLGGKKPFAFHECGTMPLPEDLKENDMKFVWFLNWHTDRLTKDNSVERINEVYNSDYVITIDELPNFKGE